MGHFFVFFAPFFLYYPIAYEKGESPMKRVLVLSTALALSGCFGAPMETTVTAAKNNQVRSCSASGPDVDAESLLRICLGLGSEALNPDLLKKGE